MIISGKEIRRQRDLGHIIIDPFDKSRCGPNSYNIRLDNKLLVYTDDVLDMAKPNPTEELIIPESGLLLEPNRLYLGRTLEYTYTDTLVPMLEGRSSVGRLGVFIHATAGFGDVGFAGYWTLEISAVMPVRIYPGVEIGQLYFHTIEGGYEPYRGKYFGNGEVQASMLYKDFQK